MPTNVREFSISHAEFKELVNYDPETGLFIWGPKGRPMGRNRFSRKTAGKRCGYFWPGSRKRPYYGLCIGGEAVRAHRAAWFWMTGKWPKVLIDHLDGNGLNNAFSNLREADYVENRRNLRVIQTNNKSGATGVVRLPNAKARPWRAYITHRGVREHLGHYATMEEAKAVRRAREKEIGGEFFAG